MPNTDRRKGMLELRSRLTWTVRRFFHRAGYLEIDTPVRVPTPAMEPYINAEPSGEGFLRTSPELHMKRLLAAGHEKIFQIGPCFRAGEAGTHHRPEFTLLEWYRTGTDAAGILEETKETGARSAPRKLWAFLIFLRKIRTSARSSMVQKPMGG